MSWMEHLHHVHHHLGVDLDGINPMAFAGFGAIFSYSFLVSLHCIGMCGPLACSVVGRHPQSLLRSSLLYNGGRVVSYTVAGAVFGLLSQQLTAGSLRFGAYLSVTLGLALMLWALLPNVKTWLSRSPLHLPSNWLRGLRGLLTRLPPGLQALGLGLITIFLPCMTLHPLLLAAAATRSPLGGACTLLAFALGTLPAMLSATYMPTLLTRRKATPWWTFLGKTFLLLAGLITVLRAWTML